MVSMADLDPMLNTSHPFYDVARHGILQVAGRLTIQLHPRPGGTVFWVLQGGVTGCISLAGLPE